MNEEYSMLRDEIMLCMKTVKDYNNLLYTATAALLAFAFNSSEGILFLLPFVVIVPLYTLIKREMMQAMRIGAYINVFLEEKTSIQWESRLISYDTMFTKNKHRLIPINAYAGLSFLCIFLSAMHTNYSTIDTRCKICLAAQVLLTAFCIVFFIFKSPNYAKMKKGYLAQWTKVKCTEAAKSHSKI